MKKSLLSIALATASLTSVFAGANAHAVEGLSANVGVTSNYLWRGVTQTDDSVGFSGGLDYEHGSGFYVGTWASNVDFGDDASYELDLYAGFSGELASGLGYDLGYIYYAYPDSAETDDDNEYDFGEVYGSLSYSYFSFTANYVVNNDDGAEALDSALYLSLDAEFEVAEDLTLAFHLGDFSFDDDYDDGDYNDYSVSLSKAGFTLTLSDTDLDNDDPMVVVSYAVDIDI